VAAARRQVERRIVGVGGSERQSARAASSCKSHDLSTKLLSPGRDLLGGVVVGAEGIFRVAVGRLTGDDLAFGGVPRQTRREVLRSLARMTGMHSTSAPREVAAALVEMDLDAWEQPLLGGREPSLYTLLLGKVLRDYSLELGDSFGNPSLEGLRRATDTVRRRHPDRIVDLLLAWVVVRDLPAKPHAMTLLSEVGIDADPADESALARSRIENLEPTEGDEPDDDDLVALLETAAAATEAAATAATRVAAALAGGRAPVEGDLRSVGFATSALERVRAAASALGIDDDLDLDQIAEAYARKQQEEQRRADEEAARLTARQQEAARVRSIVLTSRTDALVEPVAALLDLTANEVTDEDLRRSLLALADLVDMADQGANASELFTAAQSVTGLPPEVHPVVMGVAMRLVTNPEGDVQTDMTAPPPAAPEEDGGVAEGAGDTEAKVTPDALAGPSSSSTDDTDLAGSPLPIPAVEETDEVPSLRVPGERDLDAAVAEMLDADRPALARWLLLAAGSHDAAAAAVEAWTLAPHLTVAESELGASFAAATEQVRLHGSAESPPGMQVLALLALTTACFKVPISLNHALLRELVEGLGGEGGIKELAEVLMQISGLGLLPADWLVDATSRQVELDAAASRTTAEAQELLAKGRHRNIVYAPATRVWQELMNPEGSGGRLAAVLAIVAADDVSRIGDVERETTDLASSAAVERLIDSTRSTLGFRKVIEARARTRLGAYIEDVVRIAGEWSTYRRRGRALIEARRGDVDRGRTQLREKLTALAPSLKERSDGWAQSSDPVLAAAGRRAALVVDELTTLVQEGRLEGPSPETVESLLNADLLRMPSLPMSGLRPRRPPAIDEILDHLAHPPTFDNAFRERMSRHNLSACRSMLRLLEKERPDEAERFASELSGVAADIKHVIGREIERVETDLGLALADGLIDEIQSSHLQARLVEIDVSAEEPDQDEIEAVLGELRAELEERRAAVRPERESRLETIIGGRTDAGAEADRRRVLDALDDGSLGVVDEFLALLEDGLPLPTPEHPPDTFDTFFPSAVDAASSVDVGSVIAGERPLGDLPPRDMSPERRRRVLAAWEAWETLGHQMPSEHDLVQVLRELGLGQPRATPVRGRPAPDRWWFDLVASPQGKALIPQFGSLAEGRYRLVVVQDRPTSARLLSYVKSDRDSSAPVVLLYCGVLSTDARRTFSELSRQSSDRRPVAIIDDASFAAVLQRGDWAFTQTMECTLPFTAVNPYTPFVAGQVPEEMFYGRDEERRQLLDPNGPQFVYGGRQLGKSALLRDAARRANLQGDTALYIDLAYEGIGAFRQSDEIWGLLSQRLADEGVGRATKARISVSFDSVRAQIQDWLSDNPGRRLFVFLDECDNLLDDDVRRAFAVTQRIRGLVDDNRPRVKFVLAGLHVVQRFERIPNQPLAHVAGGKVVIGPLEPGDSARLISEPLSALGYRFEDPHLVHRIAAYTNNQASIIQLVADRLMRQMLEKARPIDAPPHRITSRDVSDTLADPKLQDDIRQRFEWTIDLDRRYRAIAMVAAEHAYTSGASVPLDASILRHECKRAWPQGFVDDDPEAFTALLREMEGLGVLRRIIDSGAEGEWGLRTPSLLRLLGSHYRILENLDAMSSLPADEVGFDPTKAHRSMSQLDLPSPLSEEQVRRVLDGHGVLLAIGSTAVGMDEVPTALEALAGDENLGHNFVAVGPSSRLRGVLREAVSGETATRRIVVADARRMPVDQVVGAVKDARRVIGANTAVTVVVLCDVPSPSILDLFSVEQTVVLRRWDRITLDTWLRDAEVNLNTTYLDELATVTGGWRLALKYWDGLRSDPALGLDEALVATGTWLASEVGASAMWEAVGVERTPDAHAGWLALTEFDDLPPEELDGAIDVIGMSQTGPGAAAAALRGLSSISEHSDVETGALTVQPEQVLLGCDRARARPS
jgi:hypothetical protein